MNTQPKFKVGDQVQIHVSGSPIDGHTGVIIWINQYPITKGPHAGKNEYTLMLPTGPDRYILEENLEKVGEFDLSGYIGWQGGPDA